MNFTANIVKVTADNWHSDLLERSLIRWCTVIAALM